MEHPQPVAGYMEDPEVPFYVFEYVCIHTHTAHPQPVSLYMADPEVPFYVFEYVCIHTPTSS
jgi:hypothetical protein